MIGLQWMYNAHIQLSLFRNVIESEIKHAPEIIPIPIAPPESPVLLAYSYVSFPKYTEAPAHTQLEINKKILKSCIGLIFTCR
ncbi:MAG: hypothetical protein COA38_12785 [Fluviicola sp.]|nr:MAG: hypothetical protein COA38_12785 [Fluviicola sp.]